MPESNNKLKRFTELILKEASSESEALLDALHTKRTTQLAETREAAEAEAKSFVEREITRMQAETGREVSRRVQESKQKLFVRRNELEHEVFEDVFQRISAYTKTPEYVARLSHLLENALSELNTPASVRVFLRPCDRVHEEALQKLAPKTELTFVDGSFLMGGLMVEAPKLGVRVDASFDSRLQELRGHFAELFGISLAGVDEEVAH